MNTSRRTLSADALAALVDFCDFDSMPYDPLLCWYAYPPATKAKVAEALDAGEPDYELRCTVETYRFLLTPTNSQRVIGISNEECCLGDLARQFPHTAWFPVSVTRQRTSPEEADEKTRVFVAVSTAYSTATEHVLSRPFVLDDMRRFGRRLKKEIKRMFRRTP